MTAVMQGVRILEVAEHTFVPAASALLADWGAEVIKVEHVERGDAMRGLAASGIANIGGGDVHVLLEHSNRGKKSIGLDLTSEDGLDILHKLIATSDVFLTNKLPSVRAKLKIDVDDVTAHNPDIIYVSGTGQGENGPDADKGSYDSLAYWCRAGVAAGMKHPDEPVPMPPAPAFGDSIGAMTIAGGIMGALFHRANTGEATTVDVSLLSTGLWSMGAALALSVQFGMPWAPPPRDSAPGNPLTAVYETKDGRHLMLTCLQPGKYWAEAATVVGRADLATDERFKDAESVIANAGAATEALTAAFKEHTLDEWRTKLEGFTGQWAAVQNTLEAIDDPQTVANGYVANCQTDAGTPYKLAAAPVQFGGEAAQPQRAPDFNEHGDALLEEIGIDWDTIVDLKVRGVVA